MNNEILGGLKNALERGESIDKAVQSFINAGYNPQLVHQAAIELSSGITQISNPSSTSDIQAKFPIYKPNSQQPMAGQQLKGSTNKLVIGLIVTFTFLIAALIFLILFKSKTG